MNSKRFFFVMIGLVSLLGIGIIASAVIGDSLLQKQSAKLVSLKTDNLVLDAEQVSLAQAKRDGEKYTPLEMEAQAIVPQDKDQAEAVRELVNIAGSQGVKIASITFPPSSLGSTSTPVTPSSSTPSSTPASNPALSQVQTSGIPGVYILPITVVSDSTQPVGYDTFINFLTALEQNRRTAQVASIVIQPNNPQDPSLFTFTLVVNVYLKP